MIPWTGDSGFPPETGKYFKKIHLINSINRLLPLKYILRIGQIWVNNFNGSLTSGFFMNQFSPRPGVYHGGHSNFYENSRRYSKVRLITGVNDTDDK
jgi:hypothetical protein